MKNRQQSNTNHNTRRRLCRLTGSDGQTRYAHVSRSRGRRLEQAGRGAPVRVDRRGRVKTTVSSACLRQSELDRGLERFRLQADPLPFEPHVPADWQEHLELWASDDSPQHILLYGPEGTGKDTLVNLRLQQIREKYGDKAALLTIRPEEGDRWVGHLETKPSDFARTVGMAKDAGLYVYVYFRELESLFATGHFETGWERRFKAELRDMINGQRSFAADCIMASTNRLSSLGPALLSRFHKHPIRMSLELAQGVLDCHWPEHKTNGVRSTYVIDRLGSESIVEMTLASRNTVALRATDITGLNGRFLADLAADIRGQVRRRRRKDGGFVPDQAFVDQVLRRHLEAIVAPVAEAVRFGRFDVMSEFFVEPLDRLDPPIAVKPTLEWSDHSSYLAS